MEEAAQAAAAPKAFALAHSFALPKAAALAPIPQPQEPDPDDHDGIAALKVLREVTQAAQAAALSAVPKAGAIVMLTDAENIALEYDPLSSATMEEDPIDIMNDPLSQALREVEAAASIHVPDDITIQTAYTAALREQYPVAQTIYIGGLSGDDDIQPEHLLELFQFCGGIKRITIKINRITGAREGHAYVDFVSSAGADTAMSLDGSEFLGRNVTVKKKAFVVEPSKGFSFGGGKGFGKGGGKGFGKGCGGKGGGGGWGGGGGMGKGGGGGWGPSWGMGGMGAGGGDWGCGGGKASLKGKLAALASAWFGPY